MKKTAIILMAAALTVGCIARKKGAPERCYTCTENLKTVDQTTGVETSSTGAITEVCGDAKANQLHGQQRVDGNTTITTMCKAKQ